MCATPPGDTSPPTNLNSQAPDTLPSTPRTVSPTNPKPRLFMTTRARTPAASALAIQITVGIAFSSDPQYRIGSVSVKTESSNEGLRRGARRDRPD